MVALPTTVLIVWHSGAKIGASFGPEFGLFLIGSGVARGNAWAVENLQKAIRQCLILGYCLIFWGLAGPMMFKIPALALLLPVGLAMVVFGHPCAGAVKNSPGEFPVRPGAPKWSPTDILVATLYALVVIGMIYLFFNSMV
ncbi:MAG: hypothetical protein AB7S38_00350 [Vulcanimicrobiota bacterium]